MLFVLCGELLRSCQTKTSSTFLSFLGVSGNRIWQRPGVIVLVSQPLGSLEPSLPSWVHFSKSLESNQHLCVAEVALTLVGCGSHALVPFYGTIVAQNNFETELHFLVVIFHGLWQTYLSHTCTKHTNVAQMLHKYLFYNLTTLSETQPLYSPTYRATESTLNTNTQQTPDKHIRIYRKIVVGWVTCCRLSFPHLVVHVAAETRYIHRLAYRKG